MAMFKNENGKTKFNLIQRLTGRGAEEFAKAPASSERVANFTSADIDALQVKTENPRNLYNLYTTEFSSLTSANIHFYLEVARKGMNFWKALLFDEIRRRDLRIGAVCQTRKLGVLKKEWSIAYSTSSKVGQAQQEETVSFLNDVLKKIGLVNFMTDCIEAALQGIAKFEINWTIDGKYTIPESVNYIQGYMLCYDDRENKYFFLDYNKCDAERIRNLGWTTLKDRIEVGSLVVPDLHPLKELTVKSLDGNAPNGFLNGCIDSIIWAYLFKNYGVKDWAIWVERFATPAIYGKEPTLMSASTKASFLKSLQSWGKSFVMIVPKDAEVGTMGDKNARASSDAFERFVSAYWNTEIAIRVLGQSLTTGSGDGKGSYALGKVHDQVREDYLIADMMMIKDAVNEIIRRICKLNFPGLADMPEFSFTDEVNIDFKKTRMEIMKTAADIGYRVKQEVIEEEFDFEVEPAAPTGAQGGAGFVHQFAKQFTDDFLKTFFEDK